MRQIFFSSLIFFSLVMSSCDEETLTTAGTVRYLDFEGGFYGIVADNGEHYDPNNLPAEFRQDGLRVEFEFKVSKEQVSFHMWGTIIEILSIRKLE